MDDLVQGPISCKKADQLAEQALLTGTRLAIEGDPFRALPGCIVIDAFLDDPLMISSLISVVRRREQRPSRAAMRGGSCPPGHRTEAQDAFIEPTGMT